MRRLSVPRAHESCDITYTTSIDFPEFGSQSATRTFGNRGELASVGDIKIATRRACRPDIVQPATGSISFSSSSFRGLLTRPPARKTDPAGILTHPWPPAPVKMRDFVAYADFLGDLRDQVSFDGISFNCPFNNCWAVYPTPWPFTPKRRLSNG